MKRLAVATCVRSNHLKVVKHSNFSESGVRSRCKIRCSLDLLYRSSCVRMGLAVSSCRLFVLNEIACKLLILKRKWWNWQTHHLEGVAPKGVGVQIPPSAPIALIPESERPAWKPVGFVEHGLLLRCCTSHSSVLLPDRGRSPAEREKRRHRRSLWRSGQPDGVRPARCRNRLVKSNNLVSDYFHGHFDRVVSHGIAIWRGELGVFRR